MKDAIALLFTRLAEWVSYPKVQLRELYAPLDLLTRDATALFGLYPEVLLAPEAAGKISERQLRQARNDAEKVMDEAHAVVAKMEELIRAKWNLVDRDDVEVFAEFLDHRLRHRHSSKAALELNPVPVYDADLADRVRAKAQAKRRWPFVRLRRRKPDPRGVRLGGVFVGGPAKIEPRTE